MDEALFRAVNSAFSGPAESLLMVTITTPETWTVPIILFAIGLVAVDPKRGSVAVIAAIIAVGIGDGLATHVLKPLFARPRPCVTLAEINLLAGCSANSFSLPSNHAVNSMAVAGAIGGLFYSAAPTLFSLGVVICVSRLAVGVHYPSDVTVGALIGLGIGLAVASSANRLILGKNELEQQ